MSDSEKEDFMSDAFLASLESKSTSSTSKAPKTYQESRRQALAASQAKNKANALKPYREREEAARKEGMEKNLFERELEKKEGVGKAMGMMMKMGYKVGEGLGKKRTGGQQEEGGSSGGEKVAAVVIGEVVDDEEEEGFGRGGIGSSKRRKVEEPAAAAEEAKEGAQVEASSSSSGHRFEPVAVSFWAGRKGLGSKAAPPPPPRPTTASSSTPALDPTAYRSRAAIEYAEKKAEGQLGAARRTVVELDERENRGFSILHLNPHYIPSFPEPILQHLTGHAPPPKRASSSSILAPPPPPIESFENESNAAAASLLKRQMEADSLAPILTLEEEEEEVGGMGDAMAGGKKTKQRREEEESEKKDAEDGGEGEDWEVLAGEARKFILLPATERLAHTLQYLREDFHYCFHCGVEYRSAEELEQDCPGETEDDH